MTEETKKAFTAPWHSNLKDDYVEDAKGFVIAKCLSNPITNCISHLPELYDAMLEVFAIFCGILSEDDCKRCQMKETGCRIRRWRELMQKVRDGE